MNPKLRSWLGKRVWLVARPADMEISTAENAQSISSPISKTITPTNTAIFETPFY